MENRWQNQNIRRRIGRIACESGESKMRPIRFMIALALLGLAARQAMAQASTTYSYQYIAQQSAYMVPTSSNLTINLYLQETNSDQSSNSLLASEHGLTAAGVQVAFTSGNPSATITAANFNGGTVPTGFDDAGNTATFTATSASISESTDPDPFGPDLVGVAAGPQTLGVSNVFLGSITLTTGPVGGVSTRFTVGTNDPLLGATFTNDNSYNLDNTADPLNPAGAASLYSNSTPSTFTITTNAVPEPTIFGGIVSLLVFIRRRR
jgi:hypothetical protein